MQRLVEIVDGRNAIVEGLDEDRLRYQGPAGFRVKVKEELNRECVFNREVEEDQQLNEMMKNLGEQPSERILATSSQTLFQQAPFLC